MAESDYTGRVFDSRYKVLKKLAKGGMGTVYLGEHALVGRKVAIKVLHQHFGSDEEMVTRFYREARAAAAIGHRNIIEVLDVGATPEGDPYLVMEYLEGESLAALLGRRGRLDFATAAEILAPVLRALQATHEAGIVHRDLKPDNIFLAYPKDGPPEVKIIDFGISKMAEAGVRSLLTQSGVMIGTPAYMAPEQATGDSSLDHRADIYAVGVILYELLSGRRPFEADSYAGLVAAILANTPAPLSEISPDVSPDTERLVMRALKYHPNDRFPSAREMLAEIETLRARITGAGGLRELASTVMQKTHAAGDIGEVESLEPSDPVAPGLFARMVAESTPETRSSPARVAATRRRRLLAALGIAAGLAVLGIAAFALLSPGAPPVEATAPAAAQAPAELPVTIEVTGAPPGARIFFDGARVGDNPFRARKAPGVVPLRVEAAGFEPFSISVEPTEDRVIDVAMTPLPPVAEPDPAPAAPAAAPAKGTDPRKKIRKGGRGAEFAESFE
jgi:serine/threonine-protein kinase